VLNIGVAHFGSCDLAGRVHEVLNRPQGLAELAANPAVRTVFDQALHWTYWGVVVVAILAFRQRFGSFPWRHGRASPARRRAGGGGGGCGGVVTGAWSVSAEGGMTVAGPWGADGLEPSHASAIDPQLLLMASADGRAGWKAEVYSRYLWSGSRPCKPFPALDAALATRHSPEEPTLRMASISSGGGRPA